VARLDLDRLRTHSLGHEALQVGIDRPVLGGHGIEGRLGAPCGVGRLFRRQRFLKIPSRIGEVIDLTLLLEDTGRSSLAIAVVCHRDNIERLRARMVTAMMSLETKKAVPMPHGLREAIDSYRRRT